MAADAGCRRRCVRRGASGEAAWARRHPNLRAQSRPPAPRALDVRPRADTPVGIAMAFTISSDGARIHYEVHGSGDPVLLIMGLGSNAYGWHRTIPWLAERYQVIAFDNRGVGRSDVPGGAYTITQMAVDAVAVLDAVGHETAHVVGASLGGMIAQRVGLAHPRRVRSLTLVCTTPGGSRAAHASKEVLAALVQGGDDPSTVYRRNAWFLY